MSTEPPKTTQHLLSNWRDERTFRVARTISWAGTVLASIATLADVLFKMPLIVLAGDAFLLLGCASAIHFSQQKKRALHLIWSPLYIGVWITVFTSLYTTGGVNSPFFGAYMALLFVGGLILQSQIKPAWVGLFTALNMAFWFIAEAQHPGRFGEKPPEIFILVIDTVVMAAIMVCLYELMKTEKNLAQEIIQRYQELAAARENVTKEENSNAAKSAFLANISHELRTPLGAILGYAELLKDPQSEELRWQYSETILRNGHQLARLVDDLLDLSKVEAGKLEFENIEFKTSQLFIEVIELLNLPARKKLINLKLSFPDAVPDDVISDPLRIKQILLNVIGNAIKFTERGEINIRVFFQKECSQLKVEIQDTGQGLSPDEQTKIFKPFSQADSSVSRKFGGTGLGLSLSRNMARMLGGDLQLAWSQPGLGSQFVIYLPIKVIDTKAVAHISSKISFAETPAQHAQVLAGTKILLVDDTFDNQKLISLFLEKTGAVVEMASDGVEAIQQVMQNSYDIVLMDVQMPVMDGLQAASILRQKNYQKPLIALTAHAMKEDRDRCLAAGFDDYLTKPVDRQLLVGKIKSIISSKPTNSEPHILL